MSSYQTPNASMIQNLVYEKLIADMSVIVINMISHVMQEGTHVSGIVISFEIYLSTRK